MKTHSTSHIPHVPGIAQRATPDLISHIPHPTRLRKSFARLLLLFLASFLLSPSSFLLSAAQPPDGFRALFNGKNLSGWHGNNPHTTSKAKDKKASLKKQAAEFKEYWTVENGELVNNGKGPYATTDKDFGDIELMLEYKTVAKADSGIYLRGNPQVQIWDTTEAGGKWKIGADKGSGGLYNNKDSPGKDPLVHADRPFGEWNQVKVRMIGSRTWVWLNDKLVVDGVIFKNFWSKGKTPLPATGPIHLQTHGGEIRWRNIFIREIDAAEATKILSKRDNDGFDSMFDGKSFKGWRGATGQYEIINGSIRSKKTGNIITDKQYTDFIWKLEFKVPPGGNNGLALRYPGTGNPAYVGMCELQILDNSAKKYAELDPRQYHGSVYGKAAATRGYQRAVGEWNYQEVRVEGTTIYVELNGTPILLADLSTITEFMNKKLKADVPENGHLGFAGHGAGIAFRNLWIKELNKPTRSPARRGKKGKR